jgi:predicted ATPase with chaperone activity
MIFTMTEAGHQVCRVSLERDRYIGPAPVPFAYYEEAVDAQSIHGERLRREDIEPHFSDLVVRDDVFDAVGPAMNGGKALFLYGPPGNGKTAICQRMTDCFGGDVFVPHAILVDDFVIKVFDETLHEPVEATEEEVSRDARWIRCRRPMVIVGGELTLDDLDLAYSPDVKYYEAPFQLKANCGMLLVDDFGRQRVAPVDLLNRWIVPLESEFDFVTMHTGKKLQVPFDVFVVFSTNLDPASLVDAAFLRRVRYKLEVERPDHDLYRDIFVAECARKQVPWDQDAFDYLVRRHYREPERPFNACEPRDLLAQVQDLCAYRDLEPIMSEEILDRVAANYFVQFTD